MTRIFKNIASFFIPLPMWGGVVRPENFRINQLSKHIFLFFEKSIYFLLIFLTFFLNSIQAQIQLNQTHEKENFIKIPFQIYIDSTGKKTIKEVENQQFKEIEGGFLKEISKEYLYNFWIKFEVENPTEDTLDLLFTAGVHQSVILFRDADNQFVKYAETNQKLLPHQRLFRGDEQYIPIRFLPKTKHEFLAKISDYPKLDFRIEPKLVSKKYENRQKLSAFYDEYYEIVAVGFIISVLLFVAIFTTILFLLDRKKSYLFYATYTTSLALFNLFEYETSPYFHAFFSYLPALKFTGNSNIYVFLTHIFYYLFVLDFLEIKEKFPITALIFKQIIRFLMAVLLIDLLILFAFKRLDWSYQLYWIFQVVFPILNIILLVLVYAVKGKIARLIQIGSTFLMIGGAAGFITQIFFLENHQSLILRLPASIIFSLGTFLEVVFFSTAIGFRTFELQKEQNQLLKDVKESELRTLRSQINPHFVFNSLNSIKSYILKHKPNEAAEYLTDFSTLMRSILQFSKETLISLKDELETALLYVRLEQLRFEENFEFIYHQADDLDTDEIMIPPMLLQPYIENAIKHGLMNKEGKRVLKILVEKKKNKVEIRIDDNGIGRAKASEFKKNTPKYQSMGMSINDERVNLLNITNDLDIKIQIFDKQEGTLILIILPTD